MKMGIINGVYHNIKGGDKIDVFNRGRFKY